MCVGGEREKERQRKVYYKELGHAVTETSKSKSAGWASRLRPRRADGADKVRGIPLEDPTLFKEAGLFVLLRPSAD